MGEESCPTRLDDINLKDLDYQTTYSTTINCETGAASLQFNWVDSPFSAQIRISLDGGSTYTSINDELETYTFENIVH